MGSRSLTSVTLLLSGLLGLFAVGQEGTVLIDPSAGSIDGRVALSFWPTSTLSQEDILDPAGFEVHLVPAGNLDAELTYPCGEWFQPPPDRYKYWIEGNGQITPYSSVFLFRGGPSEGDGFAARAPVVPAGQVRLADGVSPPPGSQLRLLHLQSHLQDPVPRRELSRRVPGEAAHHPTAMPEGPIVAALWDPRRQEYQGLTRPVTVRAGEVVEVRPGPPAQGSDLVALLNRRGLVADHAQAEVEILARDAQGRSRPPDVLVPTADRVCAVWYGLEGRYVEVEARSGRQFLPPREIPLRPGRVERLEADLQPLPALEVEIRLPEVLRGHRLVLSVVELPGRNPVQAQELPPEAPAARFEHLPPRELEAVLQAGPWALREKVDLRSGRDAAVLFEPRAITVTGRVFRGDEPHAAVIAFRTDPIQPRQETLVTTDDEGAYQALLFRPGYYLVIIQLTGDEGGRYADYLREPILEDQRLDFHLPANRFRIRVVSAETREGIPSARLTVDNETAAGDRTVSQPAVTGEDGVAHLPPLRPGEIRVLAEAAGYRRAGPVVEPVPEDEEEREITIELEPLGRGGKLRLLLPDGRPATGAELRAQSSLGNARPLWTGTADARGSLTLPRQAEGAFLLIRHPDAGSAVRPWPGGSPEAEVWTLPLAAPPLTLEVKEPWGDPAPFAQLAVEVGGARVYGTSLAWLTRSPVGGTDGQGVWQGKNLPARDLTLFAWSGGGGSGADPAANVLSGALDGLATVVRFPWGGRVEIEALR